MTISELHARILSKALENLLKASNPGTMAYIRCLTSDIVRELVLQRSFQLKDWDIFRVADEIDPDTRTLTADRAVEIRESKSGSTLLLVDTAKAGAGMDGIYSAAREITEKELFGKAISLAQSEITKRHNKQTRRFVESAIKTARARNRWISLSPWSEFDFSIRAALHDSHPGAVVQSIGLWPMRIEENDDEDESLPLSSLFVNRLLGPRSSSLTPAARIEALRLLQPTEQQLRELEDFLRAATVKPLLEALAGLADKPSLWVNALRVESSAGTIQGLEIVSWRSNTGKILRWSGLTDPQDPEAPPEFVMKPDAETTGDYRKLEVRWKVRPESLAKGAAEYRVCVKTDMDEDLASLEITHNGKETQKCKFTNDDFTTLSDDALLSAKVEVSVLGNMEIEPQESEEFIIRFGQPPAQVQGGVGRKYRAFSEAVIDINEREIVDELVSSRMELPEDAKGFLLLRVPGKGKSFRVYRPPLIREVENQWFQKEGAIGRWRIKVRASGLHAGSVEFIPLDRPDTCEEGIWEKAQRASRRFAERLKTFGGAVGQVYDDAVANFEIVKDYLNAWAAVLEFSSPLAALAHTVEVQSLSGKILGLIVLPTHPLRVAWHAAYDNLVLHACYQQDMKAAKIREELKLLDGAMYPAFLPGLDPDTSFVFADTLGFHAVAMVPDHAKEPKAVVAAMAKALGKGETAESAPTVGRQTAEILGNEIRKYLECHRFEDQPGQNRLLHIHALRPGDGLTVARSLGRVLRKEREEPADGNGGSSLPCFVLDLYPSEEQRGVAGRFITDVCERRRTGSGTLMEEDRWMLETLPGPGGINFPRLRWARREASNPQTAAHLAAAFDTFDSRVDSCPKADLRLNRPIYAFGLLSFFERNFHMQPYPYWRSYIPPAVEGEKHPSDRMHTDRIVRMQNAIHKLVVANLGGSDAEYPVLRTEIPYEKADSLKSLHSLCDWVITVDRNAGIEYFDSPRDNQQIYDIYVIDCVPEREDLGCMQLITSTSNLDEVRILLDQALDQMGLSRSLRNARFLFEHLKALSGRLAIRLTGTGPVRGELIALALTYYHCREVIPNDKHKVKYYECWTDLHRGFFIPADDIRDLLPPANAGDSDGEEDVRPDLIYVSLPSRGGLIFRFVEVKYRRHLRAARNPVDLEQIRMQTQSMRKRWEDWYFEESLPAAERAVRRAKLARVLRFYVDKARRHYLEEPLHNRFLQEIDRMISEGADYTITAISQPDRGYIFCPEYAGRYASEISPLDWETRVYLFGPFLLPDSSLPLWEPAIERDKEETDASDTSEENPTAEENVPPISEPLAEENESEFPRLPDPDQEHPKPCAIELGSDPLTNSPVCWSPSLKGNPHLMVVGLPGMGKTTCLINICDQLIKQGIQPIVFSYHQDIDEKLGKILDAIRLVDFNGLGFNPLQVIDLSQPRGYLDNAGVIRDIFSAIYPELGDIQAETIRQAVKDSYVEKGWDNPDRDRFTLETPAFHRFYEILRETVKPDRGLQTLLARLGELNDYGFFHTGEPLGNLWEEKKLTIIRIHTTQNDNLQRAFASLIFYGLYKDMFRRGIQQHLTHAILFDEAHRAARLKLIPTMAKECRKYGITLVLASQEAQDFHVSLFSAIANYLVLKLTDQDAKALVRNVSTSDQERALIDRIKQMDKFKALFFSEGKKRPAQVKLKSM
ncbi:MAG: ATP-binding protein [bacterium]